MINYYPREFSRNADNKISIEVEYIDSVTNISIKKILDFENGMTNAEMSQFTKDNAPDQEAFDTLKAKKDLIEAVDTRIIALKTAFQDKSFAV